MFDHSRDIRSFIPKAQKNETISGVRGHLSASPQVIDEESQGSSHHDVPLKLREQNKFPSVELGGAFHKLGSEDKSETKSKAKNYEKGNPIVSANTPSLQHEETSPNMSLASMVKKQKEAPQRSERKLTLTHDCSLDQVNSQIISEQIHKADSETHEINMKAVLEPQPDASSFKLQSSSGNKVIKINSNHPSGSYGQSDTYANIPKDSSQAHYN